MPVKDAHEQLIQAIAKNDAFRVQALLSEAPGLSTARDAEGRTPLLLCLYFGHEDLANLVGFFRDTESKSFYPTASALSGWPCSSADWRQQRSFWTQGPIRTLRHRTISRFVRSTARPLIGTRNDPSLSASCCSREARTPT